MTTLPRVLTVCAIPGEDSMAHVLASADPSKLDFVLMSLTRNGLKYLELFKADGREWRKTMIPDNFKFLFGSVVLGAV